MRDAANRFLSLDAEVTVEGIEEDTVLASALGTWRRCHSYPVHHPSPWPNPTCTICSACVRDGRAHTAARSRPRRRTLAGRRPASECAGTGCPADRRNSSCARRSLVARHDRSPPRGRLAPPARRRFDAGAARRRHHRRQQHGVGITGVSGAGKSTAALRLAGLGLTVLSEDHTWLRPSDRRVVGFDAQLRAFDDSVQTFAPHLLERAVGRDAHGKRLLSLTQPGGQATLQSLLVFGLPQYPSSGQRVRAIWETVGLPLTQTGRQATVRGITALLAHLELQGVTRETVLAEVQERLERSAGPQSG